MAIKSHFLMALLLLIVSISCSTQNTTDIATQSSPAISGTEDIDQESKPSKESSTPLTSATLDISETAFFQAQTATQAGQQTLMAPFPSLCTDPYSELDFSPNRLWMTELCYSLEDDSLIMTVSKRDTATLWKLVYKDYTQRGGVFWDEGFRVVHWSGDGRYAYINLFFWGDGGECFTFVSQEQHGKALLRLDLQTGLTTTILPLKTTGGYGFSFAPTGRRLVYTSSSLGIKILDLQTGQPIDVDAARQFEGHGNYIWSPDGLRFVYSTAEYNDQWDVDNYSLRVVDGRTGKNEVVLESAQSCFAARDWKNDRILVVERFDPAPKVPVPELKVTVIEYDLSLNQILNESTATPAP